MAHNNSKIGSVETPLPLAERTRLLREAFSARYPIDERRPLFLITVPLRLAPLGAHSDHQGGTVTGFGIDRSIQLIGQISERPRIALTSLTFSQDVVVDFDSIEPRISGDWRNYLRGAVQALQSVRGELGCGFTGVAHGAMPIGGLSSSAAISLAYLRALASVNKIDLSPLEYISLVRAVENGYLGLHNGILDQSVIVSSERNSLTVIDCASHQIRLVPEGARSVAWEIMVVYSGLSRQLTGTPFNQRVAECHEAARELLALGGRSAGERPLLGQVKPEEFFGLEEKLSPVSRKRARHFFTEADRVRKGVDAWQRGDIRGFGQLVTESGNSSIVNFESGSPTLISLYETLAHIPGVLGTRFCGGGFQGCALALVESAKKDAIVEKLHSSYTHKHPELAHDYSIHFCETSDGITVEEVM